MNALINVTKEASSNLYNSNDKASIINGDIIMLKKKIEDSIMNNKPIIIINSTPVMECRNTIYAENYDVEEDNLYLNSGDYELHINLNETEVKHNDMCEEEFIITHEDTETKLYFLD